MGDTGRAQIRRENLRRFRERYRERSISDGYSGRAHLGLITATYLAAIALALATAGPVLAEAWWLIPAAWVAANLAEYRLHRGPMHHKRARAERLYARHAATHHRFFDDANMAVDTPCDYAVIFFPAWMHAFFIFGLGLPLVFGVAAWLGVAKACVFAAGVASYILAYEWLHLVAHLPKAWAMDRRPWIGAVVRHHRRHHDPTQMRHVNFSIFWPLGDLLFGTMAPPVAAKVEATVEPAPGPRTLH